MKRLSGPFSRIGPCKALVIGDFMLDTYTIGKAKRISPEAPVAVVQVKSVEHRPGGAGNVVLNLISLGAEVVAIGRVGSDEAGSFLRRALQDEGVDCTALLTENRYQTPVKNRVIAENQQMVRVDYEIVSPIPEQLEQQLIELLPALLDSVQIVAISDYGKGLLSRTLLSALIEQAKARKIIIIADPKGADFTKYAGATVIKPNFSEAVAAAGLTADAPLDQIAERVLKQADAESLMITRSEAGISIFHHTGERHDFPVRIREVKDVTGAGDTVLAMLTSAMANGLPLGTAAQLANLAAGIAIERLGCARITLEDMAQRLLEYDTDNKVFDEEHLFALKQVLKDKPFILLGLDGSEGLTTELYRTIRQLSQNKAQKLLIFLRNPNPPEEFISLLASLREIDFIILNHHHLRTFCEQLVPSEVYLFESKKLKRIDHHSALLN
jgi:D-beta-D-heptose 7-phosphate kinase/D-beta-D-heptose 1-phosphate adenosyltransferase